jgi:uncharacterized membrane protein YiaA
MSNKDTGRSERPPEALDDERDRDELRDRYYGLLQELRVVLPGVQVLVAFLLTAPFAQRFAELDDLERGMYGGALVFSTFSVVALITPTALHRFGRRTARAERLKLSIAMTRVGLVCLGIGMTLAMLLVSHYLFATGVTIVLVGSTLGAMVLFWLLVPLLLDHGERHDA